MLAFIGDVHGYFNALPHIVKNLPADATVIQVGDFGIWPQTQHDWMRIGHLEKPIYFIDGNHEYFPWLQDIKEPTTLPGWEGTVYIPRGSILTLEGKRIGFMGGGASVDKAFRQPGHSWFSAEEIAQDEFERLYLAEGPFDYLVTHTPPNCTIAKHFDRKFLRNFGLPESWVDPSAILVEKIWEKHGRPQLICGHMHRRLYDENVRILDVNEIWVEGAGYINDSSEQREAGRPYLFGKDPRNTPIES